MHSDELPTPYAVAFGEELVLRAAMRVASCSGAGVVLQSDPARIVDAVAEARPTVVLFHWDHAGADGLNLARGIAGACPDAAIILLADPSPPQAIEALLGEPWFNHLLGLENPWFMGELGAVLAKLDGRPIFGLQTLLPWGARIVEVPITESDDKPEVFAGIERFMSNIGVRGRMVARLQAIADEMLMNAVYDAPVNRDSGSYRFAGLSRQEKVQLAEPDRPTFSYGSDGRTFGLSISDPFGGLTPETLKRYIAKGLRRGDDQIDSKAGGAGLGLFLLFTHLNSMTLHLWPGRRTEVVGLLDIRGSYRALVSAPKSFNVFVRGGE